MTCRQLLIFILVTGLLINGVCAKKRKGGRRNKGKNAADIEESHTGSRSGTRSRSGTGTTTGTRTGTTTRTITQTEPEEGPDLGTFLQTLIQCFIPIFPTAPGDPTMPQEVAAGFACFGAVLGGIS